MPSELETAARRFKAELLRRERSAASDMVRVYGESWRRLTARIDPLATWIDQERLQGRVVPLWRIQQLQSFRDLRTQVEAELRTFTRYAEGVTVANQRDAIGAAFSNAADLVGIGAGPELRAGLVRFNPGAVEAAVGFASNGSPLQTLFVGLGNADAIVNDLAYNLAAGINPRVAARMMRTRYAVPLQRALRINRTEMLRSYRAASMDTYRANAPLLDGWIWLSAADSRTCPACFAMHGTFHPLDKDLNDHVQGRCTAVPSVKGRRPTIPTGEQEFARMTPAQQVKVLGPTAWEAWSAGQVTIDQFAGIHKSDVWGDSIRRKTLTELGIG